MADSKKLKVTLKRSLIGEKPKTRATAKALGLRKIAQSATHDDNESIRGMISKVSHLVEVDEASTD